MHLRSVDQTDDIMFQDDRLWIVYGGQYSAAGTHGSCPDRYKGKAYVGNQQWDISALGNCVAGQNCPVSPTFTDEQFDVPMGCQQLQMSFTKLRGRGDVTTVTPSAGNGYRGEVHIVDGPGAADVYDIRVTLTCVGGSSSMPQVPVRLSCTHNYGSDACHMGRIEVFNPTARHLNTVGSGTWGTVCGHYSWDNDSELQRVYSDCHNALTQGCPQTSRPLSAASWATRTASCTHMATRHSCRLSRSSPASAPARATSSTCSAAKCVVMPWTRTAPMAASAPTGSRGRSTTR